MKSPRIEDGGIDCVGIGSRRIEDGGAGKSSRVGSATIDSSSFFAAFFGLRPFDAAFGFDAGARGGRSAVESVITDDSGGGGSSTRLALFFPFFGFATGAFKGWEASSSITMEDSILAIPSLVRFVPRLAFGVP